MNLHLLSIFQELQYNKYETNLGMARLQNMACCGQKGAPLEECVDGVRTDVDKLCDVKKEEFVKTIFQSRYTKNPLGYETNKNALHEKGHAQAVNEVLGGHGMTVVHMYDIQEAISRAWDDGSLLGPRPKFIVDNFAQD